MLSLETIAYDKALNNYKSLVLIVQIIHVKTIINKILFNIMNLDSKRSLKESTIQLYK